MTWLVLGPMTSFTEAIRQDSDLVKRKVARVVLMGGAIERPGNFGVVAEWNIYAVSVIALMGRCMASRS